MSDLQSMIRKSGNRFSRDKREAFVPKSSNKKIEQDDDSKISHLALGLHPIRRLQVCFRISDELRIARMVDSLDPGNDFSQCGIMQANVIG
jgi:hypothetical protein